MGFNTVSIWIKIAIACLALGTLLFVIGFATNAWALFGNSRYGLWTYYGCNYFHRQCGTEKVTTELLDSKDWTAWYRASQAFECIGLILVSVASLIMIVFCCQTFRSVSQQIGIVVCCFGAVLAMVIGFAIFGAHFEDVGYMEIGWSMGVAIAGCILTFIAGVMTLVDLKCSWGHIRSGTTVSGTTMHVTTTRHITVRS